VSDFVAYIYVVLGVLVAVVLPILVDYIKKQFPKYETAGIPPWLKRYLFLFVFSLIVGVVSLALWKTQHPTDQLHWFTAFIVGFSWESALEKFLRPTP
jgi:hypothetical protein